MTDEITLIEKTALLMRNRASSIRLHEIAKECNISVAWLSKLQNGRLEDASVRKLERVNAWLTEKAKETKR